MRGDWHKVVAVAVGVALLVSVMGVGAVVAQDKPATQNSIQADQDAYLIKLAARLSISVEALKAAFTKAGTATLDQLVVKGLITAEQKAQMLERSQKAPGIMGPWFPHVKGAEVSVADMYLSNLASALNTTVDKLKEAFKGAAIDVVNDLAAQGKITAEQKVQMLDRISKDEGMPFPPIMGPGPGPRVGDPGFDPQMGGPGFGGDSAFLDKLATKLGITRAQLDAAVSGVHEELKASMPAPLSGEARTGRTNRPMPTPTVKAG